MLAMLTFERLKIPSGLKILIVPHSTENYGWQEARTRKSCLS
jgi:hypothetical protein